MFEEFKKQQELYKKEQEVKDKQYEKREKKLLKKIEKLEQKPNSVTIHNTSTTDNSIINNNVQLNSYGYENTNYLKTSEFIKRIKMKSNILGLLEYENSKHCHPDHKENWNIGITNLKHDTCRIYKNKKWHTKKTSEIVSENFMKGVVELHETMEIVAQENGREIDKDGNILDKQEQNIIDSYDKATCADVIDDFYVKKLKDAMDKHKQYIYDHTVLYKDIYIKAGI